MFFLSTSSSLSKVLLIVLIIISLIAIIWGEDARQNQVITSNNNNKKQNNTTTSTTTISNKNTTITSKSNQKKSTTRAPTTLAVNNRTTKYSYLNPTQIPCEGDLSDAMDICSKPLMDIIEGTIKKWPRNQKDASDLCESFTGAVKCIKDVGRRCAQGFQRTLFSTFANSVLRARNQECTKNKLNDVLKMTKCVEKHQLPMRQMVSNITNKLNYLYDNLADPNDKINGLCCMVYSSEQDIKDLLYPKCPTEGATIVRLYRAVLQDVIELMCREAKGCDDLFRNYKKPITSDYTGGLISIIMKTIQVLVL